MQKGNKKATELAALLAESGESVGLVLEDLLTPTELTTILERWHTVRLLLDGRTHRDVQKEVGISISKVTHAANLLKSGAKGVRGLHSRIAKK